MRECNSAIPQLKYLKNWKTSRVLKNFKSFPQYLPGSYSCGASADNFLSSRIAQSKGLNQNSIEFLFWVNNKLISSYNRLLKYK